MTNFWNLYWITSKWRITSNIPCFVPYDVIENNSQLVTYIAPFCLPSMELNAPRSFIPKQCHDQLLFMSRSIPVQSVVRQSLSLTTSPLSEQRSDTICNERESVWWENAFEKSKHSFHVHDHWLIVSSDDCYETDWLFRSTSSEVGQTSYMMMQRIDQSDHSNHRIKSSRIHMKPNGRIRIGYKHIWSVPISGFGCDCSCYDLIDVSYEVVQDMFHN